MKYKDTLQSHKEFVERKKRIEIAMAFDKQKDELQNKIGDIDKEIRELEIQIEERKKARVEVVETYHNVEKQKLEKMTFIYNDSEILNDIVELAEQTTFSKTILTEIRIQSQKKGVNEDDFDKVCMEKIISAEKKINQEIPHTNMIIDIMNDLGNNIKFPGEED